MVNLNLGLKRILAWALIIVDVDTPIISMNLLSHYGLLIDLKNECVCDLYHALLKVMFAG